MMGRMAKGLTGAFFLLSAVICVSSNAEIVSDITVRGGYTDNLFNDSLSSSDSYVSIRPGIKYYPSGAVELSAAASYTSYNTNKDLSNLAGEVGVSIIPTNDSSKVTVLLSAGISGRQYGDIFSLYDNYGGEVGVMVSSKVRPGVTLRFGGSGDFTNYSNEDYTAGGSYGDNDALGLFGGLNFTPFGSNSIDIQAGYSAQRYSTGADTSATVRGHQTVYSIETIKSTYHTVYASVRYSRPIAARVGINGFYSQKLFVKEADSAIYGYSVDYLSPWSSLWDGWSTGMNLKAFPGKQVILETGIAYIKKDYVENLDLVSGTADQFTLKQREDKRTSTYISLQRPFTVGYGKLIKPYVQLDYIINESNLKLYDYTYTNISGGISFKF